MGCLRSLAIRIGCFVMLGVLIALCIAYRHQILDYYHAWRGTPNAAWTAPKGDTAKAAGVVRRLERSGGPAYEDLDAADIAALIHTALGRQGRHAIDSVEVALIENEIRVRGILDLRDVPRNILGPLASMVGDHEPAAIGGPLHVDSAGRLLLTVTYLKLRDFPFPKSTIPRLLEAAHVPGLEGADVPLPVATRLGDVRITPDHVRLYRRSPR